ncbi:Defensin-like protein 5 [Ananas comosus]|uniref:Defensin-like protein 5 n=1 Tax=Ananas comosus TaxID=4615 RepID=A0A199VND2_ANACO|nr:Defensin-like protein 5 [Ananas comosus]
MRKSVLLLLILVSLFFFASREKAMVEGRTCESASSHFKGLCARSSNCASVCQGEGFPDGGCEGVRRRCMCKKPC